MLKILLVEDDPFIVEIYLKKLSSSGFSVDNATTGKDALRHVVEKSYDLILLDLVLPEINGMEFLREYKGKPAEYRNQAKVIIFSNLNSPSDREQASSAGADGFISKTDFTPTEVVNEVKRILGQTSDQETREETPAGEVVPSPPAPDIVPARPDATQPNGEEKQKILFIEDEEVFVEMFAKRLLDEGFAVTSESNGERALERALEESFDLIITDAMLPGLGGLEIIKRLRDNEQTRHVPIFLFSASLEDGQMEQLEESGQVTRALLKTKTTPSELLDAVKNCLSSNTL